MEINQGKKKTKKKKKKQHIPSNVSQRTSNTDQYAFNYDREVESDIISVEGVGPKSEVPGYNTQIQQRKKELYGVQDAKLKVKMNKQDSDKYSAFNYEEEKK